MKKLIIFTTLLTISTLSGCALTSSNSTSTSSKDDENSSSFTTSSEDISSTSSQTSSTSEDTSYGELKTISFRVDNLDEGIIPTSYTSSMVEFKKEDITLFANYITNDYAGGYAVDHFFLKENYGFISNLNPIGNLNSISFNNPINQVHVYGSNSFNNNWTLISSTNSTYYFNGEYQYFKIESSDTYFGFIEMFIEYSVGLSSTNFIYKIKDVEEINKTQAEALISVTQEQFSNDTYWQSLGYAANYQDALKDAQNKEISGYNLKTDYQIEFNPDVIYNHDLMAYRVIDMVYGDNGNSFRINYLDSSKQGPVIYKNCAYTFVEDIAAYILAFGDVPINMQYSKNNSNGAIQDWGEYGRVNYSFYSNDNDSKKSYYYETELPTHRYLFDASPNDEDYYYVYYESDYGASVANDEPYQQQAGYTIKQYNDGQFITRGTLRFCYTMYYTYEEHNSYQKNTIANPYDRNVFFTMNHYNDFQQYLNYYGGWSIRFGNTTLGNGWNEYVETNHLDSAPLIVPTSLKNLLK